MKVLVISGFLGAGKTTFLKALARRTRRDFAVMENEYGEVGLDGTILQEAPEKLNIWELTEGCICCTRKADFADSVLTIANTVDPEYLIVEPTGVGMLGKVLENLKKIQYDRIALLSPVTVVDGNTFYKYRREFGEIFEDQLKCAGTILITKMESGSARELKCLEEEISAIAPDARIFTEHYEKQPDSWFSDLLSRSLSGQIPRGEDLQADLQNLSLTDISLMSPDALLLFLNGIVSGVFGNICRSKGCLKAGSSWLRFDTADRVYSVTGCAPQEESRAVFIGKDLRRSLLREVLQQELVATAAMAPSLRRKRN